MASLYAVGGAAPLAAFGIGSLTDVPDGVVVLLIAVVPVVTVLSFTRRRVDPRDQVDADAREGAPKRDLDGP